MCQINIDKYLLARYKQGGRTLPDVDCYGLVLEFFKNELKINLPLEQSITDISQAPEGEKNFKKIVKYAEVTEINLERDKIYLCGFYTKNLWNCYRQKNSAYQQEWCCDAIHRHD